MIVRALAGLGEVREGDDLAALVIDALRTPPNEPLADSDVVVITSKVLSKAEGRARAATDKERHLDAETARTVARRGPVRIVANRLGIVQAAAGIDGSNVDTGRILLLPRDPDGSADRLRARWEEAFGCRLGVVVSDTSGRAWRVGQTDHAIGVSGLNPIADYAGRRDAHGNLLAVTAMAVADELAAAADLVKGKLTSCPVAVISDSGLAVGDEWAGHTARELLRAPGQDMFARGTREAVIAAVLEATGRTADYEAVVRLDGAQLIDTLTADQPAPLAAFIARLLGEAQA